MICVRFCYCYLSHRFCFCYWWCSFRWKMKARDRMCRRITSAATAVVPLSHRCVFDYGCYSECDFDSIDGLFRSGDGGGC